MSVNSSQPASNAPLFGQMKRIHLVGIGGAGMSAIAEILLQKGLIVSGSDEKESETTRRLSRCGAKIFIGHRASQVTGVQAVAHSSAVNPETNPEIREAHRLKLPVIKRDELLGEMMRHKVGICIAGTHGKTTTTTLTATLLHECGAHPTALIGGVSPYLSKVSFGGSSLVGTGDYMVIEADEYDRAFLKLTPTIAVITSLEAEHLDIYGDEASVKEAFLSFAQKVPFYGSVILCADDQNVMALRTAIPRRVVTYGLSESAMIRAIHITSTGLSQSFSLEIEGREVGQFEVNSPGVHDIKNALAAIAVGLEIGLESAEMAEALKKFERVSRRFDIRFSGNQELPWVIDDYAHHPTEVGVTLAAAQKAFPGKRVVAVFQPHLYSRTAHFAADFARQLSAADEVILYPIYHSRETAKEFPGITSDLILKHLTDAKGQLVDHREDFLKRCAQDPELKNCVLVFMGAGDITRDASRLATYLSDGVNEHISNTKEEEQVSAVHFTLPSKKIPLITVSVTILTKSGTMTLNAFIDTGSSDCLLASDVVQYGDFDEVLSPDVDREVVTFDSKVSVINIVLIKQIQVGSLKRTGVQVGVLDFSMLEHVLHEKGLSHEAMPKLILGYSFFGNTRMTIDYLNHELTFAEARHQVKGDDDDVT